MILYTPSSAVDSLSGALWALARPPSAQAGNVTQFLFGWVVATDRTRWLEVDTECQILVHPDAELGGIAEILQPWIDKGHLPADTNDELAALINRMRGKRFVIYDAFPQVFKDMSKTHDQMVSDGLLSEDK
ncbi:hypothetical protein UFOVP806_34 [uncultured Caudovirales phage]|uniref:Uncharacterized protein n=1 Tax=uncultured Caudovirales phage TaxID=2100421 RepID=A0A6J5NX44_9CAUD|nr:hypothetical protein UFOVP806_34 [uncultured Caudovirales phage]